MTRFDLFQNLMVMAAADGRITEEEVTFLAQRSSRWGITDAQFGEAMKFAISPSAHVTIPTTKGESVQLLKEMVKMMAVDGDLADIEKNLFAIAAATMQITDAELNELFDSVLGTNKTPK
ncbi:MAG TPA: TerB family tellurite resistance protein [Pirellulaceae bacterium]|nr:TerB family tellurite resistance protein [Pirellulaceae bacterium]